MTGGDFLNLALGAIAALASATTAVFAWGKSQAEKTAKILETQIVKLEKELDEREEEIRKEREGRLSDAKAYAEGAIRMGHRFRETMHQIVARLTTRR